MGLAWKISVSARKATWEHTADNLSVKMAARMVGVALDPTDVPACMDSLVHSVKGITEPAHVLLRSATRCARDRSLGLCVRRPCAVQPLAALGDIPVKCVLPSLSLVVVGLSRIFEVVLAKMWMNARQFQAFAKEETALTQMGPSSAGVRLATSKTRQPKNVKTSMSAASSLASVKEVNAQTQSGATSANVLVAT